MVTIWWKTGQIWWRIWKKSGSAEPVKPAFSNSALMLKEQWTIQEKLVTFKFCFILRKNKIIKVEKQCPLLNYSFLKKPKTSTKNSKIKRDLKNPAYGRKSIYWLVHIVAPIQKNPSIRKKCLLYSITSLGRLFSFRLLFWIFPCCSLSDLAVAFLSLPPGCSKQNRKRISKSKH